MVIPLLLGGHIRGGKWYGLSTVIPAQAGIQGRGCGGDFATNPHVAGPRTPAFAGVTNAGVRSDGKAIKQHFPGKHC